MWKTFIKNVSKIDYMAYDPAHARDEIKEVIRIFDSHQGIFRNIGAAVEAHDLLCAFGRVIEKYESTFSDFERRLEIRAEELTSLKTQSEEREKLWKNAQTKLQSEYLELISNLEDSKNENGELRAQNQTFTNTSAEQQRTIENLTQCLFNAKSYYR